LHRTGIGAGVLSPEYVLVDATGGPGPDRQAVGSMPGTRIGGSAAQGEDWLASLLLIRTRTRSVTGPPDQAVPSPATAWSGVP
jgi:hypothetical protein